MESDAQLVSSEFPIGGSIGFRSWRLTWPLNHFHPVLLQKSNSGLRCVFSIIVHVGKVHTTTKGTE